MLTAAFVFLLPVSAYASDKTDANTNSKAIASQTANTQKSTSKSAAKSSNASKTATKQKDSKKSSAAVAKTASQKAIKSSATRANFEVDPAKITFNKDNPSSSVTITGKNTDSVIAKAVSSKAAVASVALSSTTDSTGKVTARATVTALKPGKTTITLTDTYGRTKKVPVVIDKNWTEANLIQISYGYLHYGSKELVGYSRSGTKMTFKIGKKSWTKTADKDGNLKVTVDKYYKMRTTVTVIIKYQKISLTGHFEVDSNTDGYTYGFYFTPSSKLISYSCSNVHKGDKAILYIGNEKYTQDIKEDKASLSLSFNKIKFALGKYAQANLVILNKYNQVLYDGITYNSSLDTSTGLNQTGKTRAGSTATMAVVWDTDNDGTGDLLAFQDPKKVVSHNKEIARFVNINSIGSSAPWSGYRSGIKKVSFEVATKPSDTSHWFESMVNLTSIEGISKLDTSAVENMYGMFADCENLEKLALSHFNTKKVKSMTYMFFNCRKLSSLDLSHFNTSNVTNMSGMFYCCIGLKSLNVSKFNTAKVTNMAAMFAACANVKSLNLKNFKTSRVTDMNGMFARNSALTYLGVSKFNTAKVQSLQGMFYGCSSLPKLDISSFNTTKALTVGSMFDSCPSLRAVRVGKRFSFDGRGAEMPTKFPASTYVNNVEVSYVWVSGKRQQLSASDIASSYNKTADTYIRADSPISLASIRGVKSSYAYTGKAIKPTVTLKVLNRALVRGKDYTVSYAKGRKSIGTYTVTI